MRKISCTIFLCFVASLNAMRYRCDYSYYPEADGWLKLHKIPAEFSDARLRCALEGGVLASPINNGLNQAMQAIIGSELQTKLPVLTGIHATVSQGDFFSIEGVPLWRIHQKWAPNEPDNCDNNESCIAFYADGCFADVNCNNTYPYICYKKAPKSVRLNECGTVDNQYKYDKRTDKCYKFHTVPRIWNRAQMACAAEGAHLAIINSDTEAQVIKEIFAQHPSNTYLNIYSKDYAFAGFYNWGEQGDWRTIDGLSLQEAGYSRFAPGEPNNVNAGFQCGAVNRNALFDDNWCDSAHPFFCEKHPDSLLCENELTSDS